MRGSAHRAVGLSICEGVLCLGILPSLLPGTRWLKKCLWNAGAFRQAQPHQPSPCGASPSHSLTHRTQRPCAVSRGHRVAGAQGPVQHSRRAVCPWRGTHFQCCRVLLPLRPVGSSEVEALQPPGNSHQGLLSPKEGQIQFYSVLPLYPLPAGWQRWLGLLLCLIMFEGKSPSRDGKGRGPKGPTTHLVPLLLGNVQVSLAADDCLIESA